MPERTNPLETETSALVERVYGEIQALPKARVPFGQVPLSRAEQRARYLQVRNDPAAWAKVIQEQGAQGAMEWALAMEPALKESGDGPELHNQP